MSTDMGKVNDFQDQLFQTIDLLIKSGFDSLRFDKTEIYRISSVDEAKNGKYLITDEKTETVAYGQSDAYKLDDNVYVTIPKADSDNTKIIIGRKVVENDSKPYIYNSPFDSIFDMTENIVPLAKSISEYSLTANGEIETIEICNLDETYFIENEFELQDLERIAIKAKFRTWIPEAQVGNFGLRIYILSADGALVIHTLDTKDMFGNCYNYIDYFNQEAVFDVSAIEGIVNLKIEFFQESNFKDKYMKDLPVESADDTLGVNKQYLGNIFVKDIYLCMGEPIEEFNKDYVEIYTKDKKKYNEESQEQKATTIKLRWAHLDEQKIPYDMSRKANQDRFPDYEIRWYRYRLGAPGADQYSSIYWDRIDPIDGERIAYNSEKNLWEKTIIIEGNNGSTQKVTEAKDLNNKAFTCTINNFNNSLQQEKIKAIVTYSPKYYISKNELIFENSKTVTNPSITYQRTALTIETTDGSNGNYLIYDANNNLKNNAERDKIRTLDCYFDIFGTGTDLTRLDPREVVWRFPNEATSMLKQIEYNDLGQPQYILKSSYQPKYYNNTVYCSYELNGVTYSASKEFTFGQIGTMGYDKTVVIDFVGNHNAIIIDQTPKSSTEEEENIEKEVIQYKIMVQLFENDGKMVDLSKTSITWNFIQNTGNFISYSQSEDRKDVIELSFNKELTFENVGIHIISATIGEDEGLTTYFVIPFRDSSCQYIGGPTQITYCSDGYVDWYKHKYQVFNNLNQEIENLFWSVYYADEKMVIGNPSDELIYNCPKIEIESTSKTDENGNVVSEKQQRLKPASTFVSDYQYFSGIQCMDSTNKIIWKQGLLVLQNNWAIPTINAWDGNTLEIDPESSEILATRLAAGKKDKDNKFTGVVLGDWSENKNDKSLDRTGIFGYHEGGMCYAFKDDGTAFIGKAGSGRIELNGQKGTIKSSSYNEGQGMLIDLDDGVLNFQDTINKFYIDFGMGHNKVPPHLYMSQNVQGDKSLYEEFPLLIGDKFSVQWDGTITGAVLKPPPGSGDDTIDDAMILDGSLTIRRENELYGRFGMVESNLPGITSSRDKWGIGILYNTPDSYKKIPYETDDKIITHYKPNRYYYKIDNEKYEALSVSEKEFRENFEQEYKKTQFYIIEKVATSGALKLTGVNSGLNFKDKYLTLNETSASLGIGKTMQLAFTENGELNNTLLSSSSYYQNNTVKYEQYLHLGTSRVNGSLLGSVVLNSAIWSISEDENGNRAEIVQKEATIILENGKIKFFTPAPEDQEGIYARFA